MFLTTRTSLETELQHVPIGIFYGTADGGFEAGGRIMRGGICPLPSFEEVTWKTCTGTSEDQYVRVSTENATVSRREKSKSYFGTNTDERTWTAGVGVSLACAALGLLVVVRNGKDREMSGSKIGNREKCVNRIDYLSIPLHMDLWCVSALPRRSGIDSFGGEVAT